MMIEDDNDEGLFSGSQTMYHPLGIQLSSLSMSKNEDFNNFVIPFRIQN